MLLVLLSGMPTINLPLPVPQLPISLGLTSQPPTGCSNKTPGTERGLMMPCVTPCTSQAWDSCLSLPYPYTLSIQHPLSQATTYPHPLPWGR